MRKYKQVKRKEVDFDLKDWAVVERRAAAMGVKTGTYIKRIAVNGQVTFFSLKNMIPIVNGMRVLNNNVNQIARVANETGNIHVDDIRKMQEEFNNIGRMMTMAIMELSETAEKI